ncbi:MAG: hypothetical protein UY09_C0049G0002 [Parcubacteria group bacterium GW2011_GWA2_47_8]|nr:MAG: hypothetical protein UY09_C0049G0002 [Parcubacteria group bacterium GW2011_GWA2_47_8]OHB20536.1 MAG: hypothetical protein A2666_03675 [Parcubacteria group bacterium RIFCSPHIGHO2_01_FULL_47_10b]
MEVRNFSESQPSTKDIIKRMRNGVESAGDGLQIDDEDTVIIRTMREDLEKAKKAPVKEKKVEKSPKFEESEKKAQKVVMEPKKEVPAKEIVDKETPSSSAVGIKVALLLMTLIVLVIGGGFLWYQLYIVEDIPAVPISPAVPLVENPLPPINSQDVVSVETGFIDPFSTHPLAFFTESSQFDIELPRADQESLAEFIMALSGVSLETDIHELFLRVSGTPISFLTLLHIIGVDVSETMINEMKAAHLFVVRDEGVGDRFTGVVELNATSSLDRVVQALEQGRDAMSSIITIFLGTTATEPTFTTVDYKDAVVVFQNYEMTGVSFDYAWIGAQPYVLFGTSKNSMLRLIDALIEKIAAETAIVHAPEVTVSE